MAKFHNVRYQVTESRIEHEPLHYITFQIKDDLSEPPLLLQFLIISVVAWQGVLVEVQGLQIKVRSWWLDL